MTTEQMIDLIRETRKPFIENALYAIQLEEGGKELLETHPNLAFGCINRHFEIMDQIQRDYRPELKMCEMLVAKIFENENLEDAIDILLFL